MRPFICRLLGGLRAGYPPLPMNTIVTGFRGPQRRLVDLALSVRFLRSPRFDVALAGLATLWIIVAVLRAPSWTVDDAWIVARYAENAVRHGTLSFNASGERVEGFTSPLAMVVAVLANAAGAGPIAATKLVGFAATALLPLLAFATARELRSPTPAGGITAIVAASFAEHATHARSGLETEIYVAAALATFLGLARALRSPRAPSGMFALGASLAAWTRPEGIALAALGAGAIVLARKEADRRAALKRLAAGPGAAIAALFVLRLAYYGSLAPNTYYAKRGTWNAAHARDLVALLDGGVLDLVLAAGALFVLARIVGARVRRPSPRTERLAGVALLALALDVLTYARVEPLMDYARRFAFHGLAAILVLSLGAATIAVRAARAFARRTSGAGRIGAAAGVGFALVAAIGHGLGGLAKWRYWTTRYEAVTRSHYVVAAAWIESNTAPDATIAVYPDAGIVPYTTKRTTIDFGRLNDRYLAREAQTPAAVAAYFFARAPEVLMVSEKSPTALWDPGADAIVADPRFQAGYTLVATLTAPLEGTLRLYARKR